MRNWRGFSVVLLIVLFVIFFSFVFFVNANNQISVEVDVRATDSYTSVDVYPNSIDFGEVSKGGASDRFKVTINNTGTENVFVSFSINGGNYTQKIFDYIFVRKTPGNDINYTKIKNFNFSLNNRNDQDLYFIVNLSSYTDPVYGDMIGHKANITAVIIPI